jgi:pSer/pThr/pTyr-binding forkhead associated (FHA) protein
MGAAPAEATLVEISGLNPGQSWRLPGGSEIRLGRKRDENDIPLMGAAASRRHAVIRGQGGGHVIYSQKSDNPVLVNNLPATQATLHPGDRLKLGDSEFEYRC